ncbi:MAG: lysozyme [Candidatus Sigynarchaeota archaeon]|jgi:lysozyme
MNNRWKWLLVAGGGTTILAVVLLSRRRAMAATLPTKPIPPTVPPTETLPTPTIPTTVSPKGVRFVAQFEGFSLNLRNDPAGNCEIGFGHLVHRGPCNGTEPEEFKRGITKERALELLAQDLREAAAAVARLVKVPLTQAQFDALVSFVFNVGPGNFSRSTLLKLLNQGDYASVPTQLNRYVFADGRKLAGLVRRRQAEGRLFATGDYGF